MQTRIDDFTPSPAESCAEWKRLADRLIVDGLPSSDPAFAACCRIERRDSPERPDPRENPASGTESGGAGSSGGEPGRLRRSLQGHLEECPRCRSEYGGVLGAAASLQHAFEALERRIAAPTWEQTRNIWEAIQEPSPTAALLKKTRRLSNTLLWLAVLVFTLCALLGSAWYLYWLKGFGPG